MHRRGDGGTAIRSFPDFPSPYRWLAAALGELTGRTAEAKEALKAITVSPASISLAVSIAANLHFLGN